jgi:periplasmic protein CpxP/Spy
MERNQIAIPYHDSNRKKRYGETLMLLNKSGITAAVTGLVLLAGMGLSVKASLAETSTMAPTPAPTAEAHEYHGPWAKLNLTVDQKAQLKKIHAASKVQRDGVLTQAQKDQLAAAKGNHQKHGQIWKSLNLTADQKASLKKIEADEKQQAESILTPEQLKQLQLMHQQHQAKSPKAKAAMK